MIEILVIGPGKEPEVREVEPTLQMMQEIVGGDIQCVPLEHGVDLYMNENGKLDGLVPNRILWGGHDFSVGTMFVAGRDGCGDLCSLPAGIVQKYTCLFSLDRTGVVLM